MDSAVGAHAGARCQAGHPEAVLDRPSMMSDTPGLGGRLRYLRNQLVRFLSRGPAARFLGRLVSRRGRGPIFDEGHTVILGAGETLSTTLRELEEANAKRGPSVVVVLSELDQEVVEASVRARLGDLTATRLVVRQGSPLLVHDLVKVGAGRARSIIVASDPARTVSARGDLAAIKVLLALRNVPAVLGRSVVVLELADDTRRTVVEQLGGERVELVTMGKTPARLLVQTARQAGLAQVHEDLLRFAGSGFSFHAFPQLAGKPFGKAQWHVDGAVVCGVRKPSSRQVLLNPPDELVLEKGDELLLLAEGEHAVGLVPAREPQVPEGFAGATPLARRPERILVCGGSPTLGDVLREFDRALLPGSEVTLMTGWSRDAVSELLRLEVPSPKNLRLKPVEGDPTVPDDLAKVVGAGFSAVLVVADTALAQEDAEARTVATALLLSGLFAEVGDVRPRLVAEVLDPRTRDLLAKEHGVDVVATQEMMAMLLAQVAVRRELGLVFRHLFDLEHDAVSLKRCQCYAPLAQPMPWPVIQKVARRRQEVAIGYLRQGGRPVLNPPRQDAVTFFEGDRLIVIASDDGEAPEDQRRVPRETLTPIPSASRARSALLPPAPEVDPRAVSAGPRVRGPSTEPRPPLPTLSGKPKV